MEDDIKDVNPTEQEAQPIQETKSNKGMIGMIVAVSAVVILISVGAYLALGRNGEETPNPTPTVTPTVVPTATPTITPTPTPELTGVPTLDRNKYDYTGWQDVEKKPNEYYTFKVPGDWEQVLGVPHGGLFWNVTSPDDVYSLMHPTYIGDESLDDIKSREVKLDDQILSYLVFENNYEGILISKSAIYENEQVVKQYLAIIKGVPAKTDVGGSCVRSTLRISLVIQDSNLGDMDSAEKILDKVIHSLDIPPTCE